MQDVSGNLGTQAGVSFQNALYIQKILPLFAGTPAWILHRPDLALQNVFQPGHRQRKAKYIGKVRALHESGIARIRLDLHSQLGIAGGDFETVGKALDLESCAQHTLNPFQLLSRNDQIRDPG